MSEVPGRRRKRQITGVPLLAVCGLLFEVCASAGATASAQPLAKQSDLGAYAVPFASESNRIELEVVNSTETALKDVSVQLGSVPAWVTFEATYEAIGALEPGETHVATFTFGLDEKAPVGEATGLDFEVQSAFGVVETRTIRIQPEAPTELTLRGNYPNPFNPTTRIAYALPKEGNVAIEVYNAIGRRVTRIVDQVQEAGYQEVRWNAAGVPSGVYFYAVTLDVERERQVAFGRMVVLK